MININVPYDYRGVWIGLKIEPSSGDTFTKYNWQFSANMNGSDLGPQLDPNNFVNEGPYFYGEAGSTGFGDNSIFLPSDYLP